MSKRVSEKQKRQISESFIKGKEISELSETYNFSKQTIIKQLKIILGEEQFNILSGQRKAKSGLKNDNFKLVEKKSKNIRGESQNINQTKENMMTIDSGNQN